MPNFTVQTGLITDMPANVLITVIKPDGLWFGGYDDDISSVVGPAFYAEVQEQKPLADGQMIHAAARAAHRGSFESVLFIVDGLELPLKELIRAALRKAAELNLAHVTLPTTLRYEHARQISLGGAYAYPLREIDEILTAVYGFITEDNLPGVECITLVVPDDSWHGSYIDYRLSHPRDE